MQLKDLTEILSAVEVEGPLDREITGLTYDSRRVTPGMVFIAIPGQNVDGHEFISSAIDRGAAGVICELNGFTSQRATKIKVPDVRQALARAAAAFYDHPSTKMKVIGVTGTNGKTTVAFMVKEILEAAGIKSGLIGTVRYEIGDRVIPAQRTTPESLEIQAMMAQMLRANCQACVMEVSSHALEQQRVHGVEFDVAIFTNLTQDHLDFHGSMENYFAAKQKLFSGLAKGSKQGAMVINVDDTFGIRLTLARPRSRPSFSTGGVVSSAKNNDDGGRRARILTYGVRSGAQIRAVQIQLAKDESRFVLQSSEQEFPFRVPLIGRHNVYNALAAIGAGLVLKLPVPTIQSALGAMCPAPGRLESVSLGQPFGVFVDYAHTDDALENVLSTVREITGGRVLLTFGCGGSRDTGKRGKMGKVAARLADFTLITSDNPRKESPAAIAAQIEAGYRQVRTDGYRVELDRRRAIEEIIQQAKPGDTILIAGKGHEAYQEFEDTVIPFDDRICARESLEHWTKHNSPEWKPEP